MGQSSPEWQSSRQTNQGLLLVVGSLVALALLGYLLFRGATTAPGAKGTAQETREKSARESGANDRESPALDAVSPQDATPLMVYCAAGVKAPVEAIAKAFEEEPFGVPVQLQFGGSGTLLSNLQVARRGDLFIAADSSYTDLARERQLVGETLPLARQTPVIAVAKGNPKQIASIADLTRDEVRLALANPDAASIGQLTKKLLEASGEWDAVAAHAKVFKPTVSDVANDVMLGAVDAAIVWDANVRQFSDKLDAVEVHDWQQHPQDVTAGVLSFSERPEAALRFARYMQDSALGGREFLSRGYGPVEAGTPAGAVAP
ncbi:MAG: molybdate ABC transporter substrate-binding protein [Pirellulales bacterium]|nr:molybdate ABC transporter substrate-binding protein [Pirellulales bacterium]